MEGPPRVIGLTGPNAAGKGEVARFLALYGYTYHSLSDVVREEATARGLDHSRENLIRVGNELRAAHGPGVLADRIMVRLGEGPAERAAAGTELPQDSGTARLPGITGQRAQEEEPRTSPSRHVVDSIRSPAEVAALRRLPSFLLLGVDAPIEVRFERSRARKRLGDGATLEEFVRKESLENSNDPAAQQLGATLRLADLVVQNDGTLELLRSRVAALLRLDLPPV